MPQITTVSFFRYSTLAKKFWGLQMMGKAHQDLTDVHGQEFYRMLGSGRGMGFNPLPDWSVYALIQTWSSLEYARDFHDRHKLSRLFRENSSEYWTIYLSTIRSEGCWSGINPFHPDHSEMESDSPVAVLTRATIRKRYLPRFWAYVPSAQQPLKRASGLIFSKGIGEVPLSQMATFSIWESQDAMKAYAHGSREHMKAIQLTRSLGWYREELFARFRLIESQGLWNGKVLLSGINVV